MELEAVWISVSVSSDPFISQILDLGLKIIINLLLYDIQIIIDSYGVKNHHNLGTFGMSAHHDGKKTSY